MSGKTAIQYYVPEDGDELEHPNVLLIEKPISKITLSDIRKAFPIPGTYYFRFKRSFKKNWIWFDVLDDSEVVPSFEGSIICKVTRLPARCAKMINQKSGSKEKEQPSKPKVSQVPTQTHTQTSNSATSTDTDMFFGSFSSSPSEPKKVVSETSFDPFANVDSAASTDPFASLSF